MTHLRVKTVFRLSTAPLDEKVDAIEDPLQAELEGMIGVGNSLAISASSLWQDRVASPSP